MLKNLKFLILISFLFTSCNRLEKEISFTPPNGMVWVEGKSYTKGAKIDDQYSMMREKPSHNVYVDVFFIDITEVTNKQFKKFRKFWKFGFLQTTLTPFSVSSFQTDNTERVSLPNLSIE